MSDERRIEVSAIQPLKLWFGVTGSALSWITLGCLDILITWQACTHQEDFGVPGTKHSMVIVLGLLALLLLAITIAAGVTSYHNWRFLSTKERILDADAIERHEFIALLGVFISVMLGFGICWLALPPLFLDLCWRAR